MSLAIYVRVSTQRQAQAQTIEQQLDRLRAYIHSTIKFLVLDFTKFRYINGLTS